MRSLISGALELISRHRVGAVIAVLFLVVPSDLLFLNRATTALGGWFALVGVAALQVVFLSDGEERNYPAGRVLTGLLKAAAAFVILLLIAVLAVLPVALVAAWMTALLANAQIALLASDQLHSLGLGVVAVVAVVVVFPPYLLLLPVCLDEDGGPWAALKSAWRMWRTRWPFAYGVALLVFCLNFPANAIRGLGGVGPVFISVAWSALVSPFTMALGVALYLSLAQRRKAALAAQVPLVPRSRETAAAGTFRARRTTRAARRHH